MIISFIRRAVVGAEPATRTSASSVARRENSPSQPAHRPRIGLALSGGGALGLAQIGVIEWLEENHIPVDRVAGTSMGSIIAAMYATGMSPAEIRKFAEGIDWNDALLPEPIYQQLAYRRKAGSSQLPDRGRAWAEAWPSGPNGFNSGQGVGLLLDRIAFPESGIASFDDLPIPFRCVATDMQTGDRVVLHDGSLANAVRASMAIPGVFTPVEINGRVLADGGMVENIPVEVVREMDADAVIAVDLEIPLGEREQLETLTGVLSRALERHDHCKMSGALLRWRNATITVDTGSFSITDYDDLPELVHLGYESAASQCRRFAALCDHRRSGVASNISRRAPLAAPSPSKGRKSGDRRRRRFRYGSQNRTTPEIRHAGTT